MSRVLVWLFAVTSGLAVANVYYAQPLLDAIADEFHISHATAGMLITWTQVGYGLGLLLVVPLGDVWNRRHLIIGQSILAMGALIAVGTAANGGVLIAGLAALGLMSVVAQVIVAYAAILAPVTERGRIVGIVTSGIVIGILLARTAAGAMSDWFGWRSIYFASAGVTLILTGLLLCVLPRADSVRASVSYPKLIASMFTLLVQERVLRVRGMLALFIFAAITMLLTPLVLPLSAAPFMLSHTEVGLFGLAGAAGALGASRAGRAADLGHAQRTTGVALILMLAAWGLIALLPYSLWWLAIGVVVIDFGLQSVHVSSQSLIYQVRPEARSRLAAAYMIFYSIGCAAGSIASTLIYARAGWNGVCIAGASISACALIFWMVTKPPVTPGAATRQVNVKREK